jgi:hypothetical protein
MCYRRPEPENFLNAHGTTGTSFWGSLRLTRCRHCPKGNCRECFFRGSLFCLQRNGIYGPNKWVVDAAIGPREFGERADSPLFDSCDQRRLRAERAVASPVS